MQLVNVAGRLVPLFVALAKPDAVVTPVGLQQRARGDNGLEASHQPPLAAAVVVKLYLRSENNAGANSWAPTSPTQRTATAAIATTDAAVANAANAIIVFRITPPRALLGVHAKRPLPTPKGGETERNLSPSIGS